MTDREYAVVKELYFSVVQGRVPASAPDAHPAMRDVRDLLRAERALRQARPKVKPERAVKAPPVVEVIRRVTSTGGRSQEARPDGQRTPRPR